MKASTFFPLIVGLAAAVIALSAWMKTTGKPKGEAAPQPTKAVVVARSQIPYSAKITAEVLTTVKYQGAEFPIAGSFEKIEDLVGRVTSAKIVAGAPITAAMLTPPGTPPGAIHQIVDGYRSVPVSVQSYAARHLEPGCRVDVFTATRKRGGRSQGRPSQLILQNIEVFAVGSRLLGMDPVAERVDSVELLVPAGQVAVLDAAVSTAGIRLVMRGATDQQLIEIPVAPQPEPEETVVLAEPEPPPVKEVDNTTTVRVYHRDEERTRTYERPAGPVPTGSD